MRTSLAVAALLGLAPTLALAQTPKKLLELARPTQRGVEYDTPTDKAAVDACKVETVHNKQKNAYSYILRDGQGQYLRRYLDTNGTKNADGKPHLDQWCYYKDGFEVYREIDSNEDLSIDEARWMNSGGTRIASIKGGKVAAWKRLSAEEASKVFVLGITGGDLALIESVMATPAELEALGLPKATVEKAAQAAAGRRAKLVAMTEILNRNGWDNHTAWDRFDGQMPHLIPADVRPELKADITLYEHAAIFVRPSTGQFDPSKLAHLQVAEMVELGGVWKFVDLPQPFDLKNPAAPAAAAVALRADLFGEAAGAAGPAVSPELDAALKALAEYDKANPIGTDTAKEAVAKYHRGRMELLRKVAAASGADERPVYDREIVNSLAAAYATGLDPDSGKALDALIAKRDKIASHADFRKILADYDMEAEKPDADLLAVQKDYLARLATFLKDHPDADEVPDVLFQLASGSEFLAEDDAKTYYARLAKDFPDTESGKKAAGALKRLDLVDKTINLAGAAPNGKPIDAASFRGKTLLIVFWNSEASQFKSDLDKLLALSQKHKDKGLEVLGVNLDATSEAMTAFLRENPLPWPQIHEEGGMDSRLANEYGILTLPTMFLVDPQGKVVNRGLRTPTEVERLLDKPVASRPGGGIR